MTLNNAFVYKTGADSSVAEIELAFVGLVGSDNYDSEIQEQRCLLYASILVYLSKDNVGVQSISEGGFAITYDKKNKADHLSLLAKESGCNDLIVLYATDTVQNMSNLW